MRSLKPLLRVLALAPLAMGALSARADDVSISGFGTLGYAVSNRPYIYQRFIDDKGTFDRDSVLAVQADAPIAPRWSATAQLKLAPDTADDNRWLPKLAWGFLSWRPDDDWLLRVGKLRVPLYLNAENMDVGVSFDYARLPVEMYSLSPTSDFTGLALARSWDAGKGELSLEGYWGKARTHWRQYVREGVPGFIDAGVSYSALDVVASGLVLTYRGENANAYRFGLHRASTKPANGDNWIDQPGLVTPPIAPWASFYWMLPGAGLGESRNQEFLIATFGADVEIAHGLRGAAEYAIRKEGDMERGQSSRGGYASLRKQVGRWTPYAYYAELRSEGWLRRLYQTVDSYRVPSSVPLSGAINASQGVVADGLEIFDQSSWAVGTSYSLTPTSKLKAEWMRTRVGTTSTFVDAPAGSSVRNQNIDVLSLSYSFMF